jgi:C1A family cysteine protease
MTNEEKIRKKYDKIITNNSTTLSDKLLCKQFYPDGTPKCFDWRNINGINYDTPIKKQGDCGSCYSVAMISSIESRIRI